jgi:DNA-binding transcriptional regulator YdaS (Cro superfamily)
MHPWCMVAGMDALSTAIEKAGGVSALAARLGVVPSAVTNWRRRAKVPAEFACMIEAATGVTVRELRPDLFPPAPKAQPVPVS